MIAGLEESRIRPCLESAATAFDQLCLVRAIGNQFYNGTGNDANGFPGLSSLYDLTNMGVDATGTGTTTGSVWIVWENIKGVHWVFGNGQGFNMMPEWRVQQVTGSNSKVLTGYVNNLQAWIGLAFHQSKSASRIRNVTSTQPITDKLIAQALSKFPLQMRASQLTGPRQGSNFVQPAWGGGLKIFMSPFSAYLLQNSRSAATTALTGADPLRFASMPIESNGVPIYLTNSLKENETAS